jgi:hypothetical protein
MAKNQRDRQKMKEINKIWKKGRATKLMVARDPVDFQPEKLKPKIYDCSGENVRDIIN